jgi:hypothetical protein
MEHSVRMQHPKSQILNSKQAANSNFKMTETVSFEILVIGIYLGFGAWNLVL